LERIFKRPDVIIIAGRFTAYIVLFSTCGLVCDNGFQNCKVGFVSHHIHPTNTSHILDLTGAFVLTNLRHFLLLFRNYESAVLLC